MTTALGLALTRVLQGFSALPAIWRRHRDMQRLSRLDHRMLADIGLTRDDVRVAIAAPRWRDPTVLLSERRSGRRESRRRAALQLARLHA